VEKEANNLPLFNDREERGKKKRGGGGRAVHGAFSLSNCTGGEGTFLTTKKRGRGGKERNPFIWK